MINDIQFEAAFFRAGLLVGLVHERDVAAWAMDAIGAQSRFAAELADVATTQSELSAMREALRRLSESVDRDRVVVALLTAVAIAPLMTARTAADWLRILGQIRLDYRPVPSVAAAIKAFEDRVMLAAAGVRGVGSPGAEEVAGWLDSIRHPGYFWFSFHQTSEAAAFVAALSRKVVRDRTWRDQPESASARAWVVREPAGGACTVVLNEHAYQTAVEEFSPVPLASRIPYPAVPAGATELFDEQAATPLGVEDARRMIAG